MNKIKLLLVEMCKSFDALRKTRLEMLKSFMFKVPAQQLEPVENFVCQQMAFNALIVDEISLLKKENKSLTEALNAN